MGKKRKNQVIPAVADNSSESDVEEGGGESQRSEDSGRELLAISTPIVKANEGDGGEDEDGPPLCEWTCTWYRLIHDETPKFVGK